MAGAIAIRAVPFESQPIEWSIAQQTAVTVTTERIERIVCYVEGEPAQPGVAATPR